MMSGHGFTAVVASPVGDQPVGSGRPGRRPRWRRWRLAAAACGLALACTALGGVVGGLVAVHTTQGQLDAGYSLGAIPPAPASRTPSSIAAVAARDTPAVVMIKVDDGAGTGSGFVISGGYIVTNNHVITLDGIAPGAPLQISFSNGSSVAGRLVGRDPFSDLAVIRAATGASLPALPLGNSDGAEVGDPVIAIGSPLGLAGTVTSGIVSALDRPVQPSGAASSTPEAFFNAIQTDAPINPGSSGGPLVNTRGQVIGVDAALDTLGGDPLTGSQGGSIGLGFAIPVNQARRVIVQLIRTGHATHSVMGANLNDAYSGTGAQIATANHGGQAPISRRGPAAQAGLRPGDVIVRLDKLPVPSAYALVDAVRSNPPGSRVRITFVRNGTTHRTMLTLGSARS
jgi:putative serine protease PepD